MYGFVEFGMEKSFMSRFRKATKERGASRCGECASCKQIDREKMSMPKPVRFPTKGDPVERNKSARSF